MPKVDVDGVVQDVPGNEYSLYILHVQNDLLEDQGKSI